jgi:hypothetical protein
MSTEQANAISLTAMVGESGNILDTKPAWEKRLEDSLKGLKEFLKALSWEEVFADECDKRMKELEAEMKHLRLMKQEREPIKSDLKNNINHIIHRAAKGDFCNELYARNCCRPEESKLKDLTKAKK